MFRCQKHDEVLGVGSSCWKCVAEDKQRDADNQQRRRYAEAALTGLVVRNGKDHLPEADIAEAAFVQADAMLEEQKRRESAESAS